MAEITGSELRIRALEDTIKALVGRLNSLSHKVADQQQAGADAARYAQQPIFLRAQATTTISVSSSNALGSGTVRLLQVIGTSRYKWSPDTTVTAYNDTGGSTAIPINTYLIVVLADGLFTIIVADCLTTSPTAAPDPP